MFKALHFVTDDFPHFAEFHLVASLFCKTLLLSLPSLNFNIFLCLLFHINLYFDFMDCKNGPSVSYSLTCNHMLMEHRVPFCVLALSKRQVCITLVFHTLVGSCKISSEPLITVWVTAGSLSLHLTCHDSLLPLH